MGLDTQGGTKITFPTPVKGTTSTRVLLNGSPPGFVISIAFLLRVVLNNQVKERIRQEQEEEKQRLEAEMQRLMALEEDHRKKVQLKEQEMGRIKEDLEKKWDRERRQVL